MSCAAISVIDYGAGNLHSVENALHEVGARHELIRDAAALSRAQKIMLPGVGHFGQMMHALDRLQLRDALVERLRGGVPFLGVCLGLQALFATSEEAANAKGLAILPQNVCRFVAQVRVPHMGWNTVERIGESRLLEGAGERPFMYFANSFYAPVCDATAAACEYGEHFSAVIERENIFAVQFHPEKSGAAGLRVIRNFVCL